MAFVDFQEITGMFEALTVLGYGSETGELADNMQIAPRKHQKIRFIAPEPVGEYLDPEQRAERKRQKRNEYLQRRWRADPEYKEKLSAANAAYARTPKARATKRVKSKERYHSVLKADPEKYRARIDQIWQARKAALANNPAKREELRKSARERYALLKQDPVKYQQFLERRRKKAS